MSKFMLAYQVAPEFQESPLYWDIPKNGITPEDVWFSGVSVTGNRDYCGFKTQELINFEERYAEVEHELWKLENDYDNAWYHNKRELIEDLLPKKEGTYTDEEVEELCEVTLDYNECHHSEDNNYIARALSLMCGEEYDYTTIKGCCQGEWQDCFYPVSFENSLSAFETEYFNTGAEYRVSECLYDTDEISIEEAIAQFEDEGGVYTYTHGWKDKDIEDEIRDSVTSQADVTVIRFIFDGYTRTPKYVRVS